MTDFKNFVESTKMFGKEAKRVSNEETQIVFKEIKDALGDHFRGMDLVRSLPSKQDHGDVDILVWGDNSDLENIVRSTMGDKVVKIVPNFPTVSFLYESSVGRVHVDLIYSDSEGNHDNKKHYYSYGDFAAIVGIVAKFLHYRYGSEGFYKRFQDNKGMWHDLPLPFSLTAGLRVLGFNVEKYHSIHNLDDIVNFIAASPLVDSGYFDTSKLTAPDRQALRKRTNLAYIFKSLRVKNIRRKIDDEDYFLKQHYPEVVARLEKQASELNSKVYGQRKSYNGNWIMQTFNIQPGPQMKEIVAAMNQHFGSQLANRPESEVINFIRDYLNGRSY